MPGPAVLFREIHRLRRFAHELQEQIDRLPRQQKIQQTKVARQEENLRQAQDTLKHLKVDIHSKEGTLKSTHGQIAKYQKQLNGAESKKEYDALQHEINDAKAACLRLEEEIRNGGENGPAARTGESGEAGQGGARSVRGGDARTYDQLSIATGGGAKTAGRTRIGPAG